jgi:hypothetical protein
MDVAVETGLGTRTVPKTACAQLRCLQLACHYTILDPSSFAAEKIMANIVMLVTLMELWGHPTWQQSTDVGIQETAS